MRFIITLLLFFISYPLFAKNPLIIGEIVWKDSLSLKSNRTIIDTASGLPVCYQLVDFPYSVQLKIEFLSWDTISNNGKLKNITGSEQVTQTSQSTGKGFTYSFRIKAVRFAEDTTKIIRLRKYRVYIESGASIMKNSVLASGKWHKIKVIKNALYKISYAQIKKLGFENPADVSVFGFAMGMLPKSTSEPTVDDLKKLPVLSDGNNIYFYGSDAVNWDFDNSEGLYKHEFHKYSDTSYYFLSDVSGAPVSPEVENYTSDDFIETSVFDDYNFHEKEETNLLRSGSEWFGDRMSSRQQTTINFTFQDLVVDSPVKIYYNFLSKSVASSTMVVNLNKTKHSVVIGTQKVNSDLYGDIVSGNFEALASGNSIKVIVEYQNSSDASSEGYINYLGVNVKRRLVYNGAPVVFQNQDNLGKDLRFLIDGAPENLQIWNITDNNNPLKVEISRSGQQAFFFSKGGVINKYIMFVPGAGMSEPLMDKDSEVSVKNQNIHGADVPDLIIVSPDSSAIYEQALRLAKFREANDQLKVLLVKASEIYNEFSAGRRDVTAIRNMVRYFYYRGLLEDKKISYLLMFGDGTYLNKVNIEGNHNLLPSYQSDESFFYSRSYVTDDYFGWTSYNPDEEDNLLNIGIGRLPVKNHQEAYDMVNKLIAYSNPSNDDDWRNIISFLADDEDNNAHLDQADNLAQLLRSKYLYYDVRKIYLDAYVQTKTASGESYPGADESINERVNNGALIINYTGHGNERQLAHENIINVKSIRKWSNRNKLPMFITATCEFSRWDDYNYLDNLPRTSAGEEVLLNPGGGGIALLTTTRLVYSIDNFNLNKAFYKYAFEADEDGNYRRLGDMYRMTKNDPGVRDINRINFSLLGDPSMMLAFPRNIIIKSDSINNSVINDISITDTLKALSVVRVTGHFEKNGKLFPYNGNMSVKVFDKPDTLKTLANDEGSQPYKFARQEATIFKGLVNVTDGKFNYEFPVPIDIKLNFGTGNIVYYAPSKEGGFAGYTDKFMIGGVAGNIENSYTGPDINLFMNDTNFREGGITTSGPVLLVKLYDNDGINASGIGIGHDISAILDNDFTKMFSLNSNYRTELNDFRKGTTTYSFYDLTPGDHSVKVIAWDIFNNPFEKELNFRVVDNVQLELNRVMNYPNPMRDHVYFTIEHNKPDEIISIQIYIYSFSGALVNVLQAEGYASGFRTAPIKWNGFDASGRKAGSGIYPYKMVVSGKKGSSAQMTGKLVIIK